MCISRTSPAVLPLEHTLKAICVAALWLTASISDASAIDIRIDYTYDSNNFFNTQMKRDSLEAAAARYSAVITSSLRPFPSPAHISAAQASLY